MRKLSAILAALLATGCATTKQKIVGKNPGLATKAEMCYNLPSYCNTPKGKVAFSGRGKGIDEGEAMANAHEEILVKMIRYNKNIDWLTEKHLLTCTRPRGLTSFDYSTDKNGQKVVRAYDTFQCSK